MLTNLTLYSSPLFGTSLADRLVTLFETSAYVPQTFVRRILILTFIKKMYLKKHIWVCQFKLIIANRLINFYCNCVRSHSGLLLFVILVFIHAILKILVLFIIRRLLLFTILQYHKFWSHHFLFIIFMVYYLPYCKLKDAIFLKAWHKPLAQGLSTI